MSSSPVRVTPPTLKLQTSVMEEATVVKCRGRLIAEVTPTFKIHVKDLIPGAKRVVLDFTEIEHMDSSGLGAVVSLYVSARTAGCQLGLINFNKRVRELLGMTHLLSALEVCGKYMVKMH